MISNVIDDIPPSEVTFPPCTFTCTEPDAVDTAGAVPDVKPATTPVSKPVVDPDIISVVDHVIATDVITTTSRASKSVATTATKPTHKPVGSNDYMKFIVDPPKPKPVYKTSGLFRLPTTKEIISTTKHYIKCVPHMPIIKDTISNTIDTVVDYIPGKELMSKTIKLMKTPMQVYDNYMNSLTYDINDPDY